MFDDFLTINSCSHLGTSCTLCEVSEKKNKVFFIFGSSSDMLCQSSEVEGIQGAGPEIFIWGAGSPKSLDHGDYDYPPPVPALRVISPPPLMEMKSTN